MTAKFKAIPAMTAVGIAAVGIHAALPPVRESRLRELVEGRTTRVEATRLFGTPTSISRSATGRQHWHYSVALRFGYLDMIFDESSRLVNYNYERF